MMRRNKLAKMALLFLLTALLLTMAACSSSEDITEQKNEEQVIISQLSADMTLNESDFFSIADYNLEIKVEDIEVEESKITSVEVLHPNDRILGETMLDYKEGGIEFQELRLDYSDSNLEDENKVTIVIRDQAGEKLESISYGLPLEVNEDLVNEQINNIQSSDSGPVNIEEGIYLEEDDEGMKFYPLMYLPRAEFVDRSHIMDNRSRAQAVLFGKSTELGAYESAMKLFESGNSAFETNLPGRVIFNVEINIEQRLIEEEEEVEPGLPNEEDKMELKRGDIVKVNSPYDFLNMHFEGPTQGGPKQIPAEGKLLVMEDEAEYSNQPEWWRKVRVHSDLDTTEWSEERRVGWVSERFVEKTGEVGAILEGTVIDAETKEVIDGVEVTISGDELDGSRTEISKNGKYTFVVPHGTYSIELSHEAYSDKVGNVEITEFETELTQELEVLQLIVEVVSLRGGSGEIEVEEGPYKAGELVEVKATPDTEEDAFQYWTTRAGEAEDYFTDYESLTTNFRMPEQSAVVMAHFIDQEAPQAEFDYDHTSFGVEMSGRVGVTEHYWDISELEPGERVNFYFHARNIPDNFKVSYGNWGDFDQVFDSGWVSLSPSGRNDPSTYPGGVKYHDWHENVVLSDEISWGSGGLYAGIVEKEVGKDVLKIRAEGKDRGTVWDYKVDVMEEVDPTEKEEISIRTTEDLRTAEEAVNNSIHDKVDLIIRSDVGDGGSYSFNKAIEIKNSDNYTIDASLEINNSYDGELLLGDRDNRLTLTGDLTIDAPNATIVNNLDVQQKVTVDSIADNTFENNALLKRLDIRDTSGGRIINNDRIGFTRINGRNIFLENNEVILSTQIGSSRDIEIDNQAHLGAVQIESNVRNVNLNNDSSASLGKIDNQAGTETSLYQGGNYMEVNEHNDLLPDNMNINPGDEPNIEEIEDFEPARVEAINIINPLEGQEIPLDEIRDFEFEWEVVGDSSAIERFALFLREYESGEGIVKAYRQRDLAGEARSYQESQSSEGFEVLGGDGDYTLDSKEADYFVHIVVYGADGVLASSELVEISSVETDDDIGDIEIENPAFNQAIRADKIDDFEFEWYYSGSISSLDSFKIVIDAGEGVFYYKEDISIENTSFKQSRDGQFDITDNIEGELGVGDYTIHIEGIVNGEEEVRSELIDFEVFAPEIEKPSQNQLIMIDDIDDFEFEWNYAGDSSELDSFKIVIDDNEGGFYYYYKEDISVGKNSFKQSRDGQFDTSGNAEGELGEGNYTVHIEGIVNNEEEVRFEGIDFVISDISSRTLKENNQTINLEDYGYANPLDEFENKQVEYAFYDQDYASINHSEHTGVDWMANAGDPIYAIDDGEVVNSRPVEDYGGDNFTSYVNSRIVIKHTNNGKTFSAIYMHIKDGQVNVGDTVDKGDRIGNVAEAYYSNNIRYESNDHLHFGINVKEYDVFVHSGLGTASLGTDLKEINDNGFRDPINYLISNPN